MYGGNNLQISGGGVHHVAIQASNFEASLHFYTEGLGFQCTLQFVEDGRNVAMFDTRDGTYLELFSGGNGTYVQGVLMHLALRTDNCDAAIERARIAGATVTIEPTDVLLQGEPAIPVRYAFCQGPDGEEIEFLQSKHI
jgi:glyoxylase I family protein